MKQIEAIQQQDAIILNQRKRIEEYCNQIQDVYSDINCFRIDERNNELVFKTIPIIHQ